MADGAGGRQETRIYTQLTDVMKEWGPGFNKTAFKMLQYASRGSDIHLVSNCESVTDWDISDTTNFNCVNEGTYIRTGSNSLEMVDGAAAEGYITLDDGRRPQGEDWGEYNWIGMWVYDDTALRLTGELKVQIRNNLVWGAAMSVPVNTTAGVYEYKCIDMTGQARDRVDGFRFVNNRIGSAEKVYVDEIIVTDLITGAGAGSTTLSAGPVIGPVREFPIKTGETMTPGLACNWEGADGLCAAAADDTAIVGICCQDVPFTTLVAADATPKRCLVAMPGSIVIMRNGSSGATLADGALLASGVVTLTDATTNVIKSFARSLETATANADTYFILTLQYQYAS